MRSDQLEIGKCYVRTTRGTLSEYYYYRIIARSEIGFPVFETFTHDTNLPIAVGKITGDYDDWVEYDPRPTVITFFNVYEHPRFQPQYDSLEKAKAGANLDIALGAIEVVKKGDKIIDTKFHKYGDV